MDDENIEKSVSFEFRGDSRRLFFTSLAAQGGALIVAKTLTAPIDRMRLLRQVGVSSGPGWHWRGCGTHLAQISLSNAARLLLVVQAGDSGDSFFVNWGVCTAAVALAYPLDVRYTRRVSGLAGPEKLFPAFRFSLLATPIFLGTALSTVGLFRRFYPGEVCTFPGNVVSGAVAGLVAGGVTYPLDTLRRREVLGLARPETVRTLFGGFGFHLMKAVPEYCILAVTYSYLVNLKYI